MKTFIICQTNEAYVRLKCKEMVVDKDGILLASLGDGNFAGMFKEWSYWTEEGFEVEE